MPIKMFRLANLSLTGRPSGSFATSPAVEPILTPHGSPIPTVDGKVAAGKGVPIAQLEAGDQGTVAEVEDRDPDFLRYLSSLGIKIGSTVELIAKEPYGGPVRLRLARRNILMGTEAAARVRIERSVP